MIYFPKSKRATKIMRTNKTSSRIFAKAGALIIALVLLVSLTGCYNSSYYIKFKSGDIVFGSIDCKEPNYPRFIQLMDSLKTCYGSFIKAFSVNKIFTEAYDIMMDIVSLEAYTDILTKQNVNDTFSAKFHDTLKTQADNAKDLMWEAADILKTDVSGWMLRLSTDLEKFCKRSGGVYSEHHIDEVLDIEKQEKDLVSQYHTLSEKEYYVDGSLYNYESPVPSSAMLFSETEDGEEIWLVNEDIADRYYYAGYLTPSEYIRIINDIYANASKDYADILSELVSLRKRASYVAGFNSYSDYSFIRKFARDYTPSDIQNLSDATLSKALETNVSAAELIDQHEVAKADEIAREMYSNDLISSVTPLLEAIDLDTYIVVLRDLTHEKAYDYRYYPSKKNGSFTTLIPYYDIPFIYIQPQENATWSDLNTFFHEFGHYLLLYNYPENGYLNDRETSETASLSFELMTTRLYGILFDNAETCKALYHSTIAEISGSIVRSYFINEFENRLFAEKSLDREKINDIYYQLLLDYGMIEDDPDLKEYYGSQWIYLDGIFESSYSSISDCVAAVAAIGVFFSDDPLQTFNKFIANAESMTLRENCAACGIPDPLDPAEVLKLLDTLNDTLN